MVCILKKQQPYRWCWCSASIPVGANLNLRSINGIGQSIDTDQTDPAAIFILFDIDKPLGSLYNLGDFVYFKDGADIIFLGTLVGTAMDSSFTGSPLAGIIVNTTNAGTYLHLNQQPPFLYRLGHFSLH